MPYNHNDMLLGANTRTVLRWLALKLHICVCGHVINTAFDEYDD